MRHGFVISLLIVFFALFAEQKVARAQLSPSQELLNQKPLGLQLNSRNPATKDQESTLRLIDSHEKAATGGPRNTFGLQTDLTIGQERASAMIKIIQDVEMKKALEKINEKGKSVLNNNSEIRTPVGILAGAVSLWAGRTVTLFKTSDVKFSSYLAAKSRSGSFNMDSPLFNGQLKYDQTAGIHFGVNRSISSFNTSAGLQYNLNAKSVTTQLYQRIVPHLSLSLGAGQNSLSNSTEGSAQLQYDISF